MYYYKYTYIVQILSTESCNSFLYLIFDNIYFVI